MRAEELTPSSLYVLDSNMGKDSAPCVSKTVELAGSSGMNVGDLDLRTWEQES